MAQENIEKLINFLNQISNLKNTLRYAASPDMPKDSVAAHDWRLALMVFLIADALKIKIDATKALRMALIKDLAETFTKNIDATLIAQGKVTLAEKEKNESQAMKDLANVLPQESYGDIMQLWEEYNQHQTPEAKFVKAISKLETLTHIIEAGYKCFDKPQFIPNYADKAVQEFPELKEMLAALKAKLKSEFEKGNIEWKPEYNS